MISSPSPALERGLDTMIVVYSLLHGHPASTPCEHFLRSHSGWFTSPLVLIEARNVLTKVYGVDTAAVTAKLLQFAAGPVATLDVDESAVTTALQFADIYSIDVTDAVLLHLAKMNGATYLATEDQRLTRACLQLGIAPESPLDPALRQQVASWEVSNLAPKGLPRVLHRVHQWLRQTHTLAAQDFWSQTGGACHLP
jgi:predicted nucleic acid-binding protein